MRAKRLLYSICFLLGLLCLFNNQEVKASEESGYIYWVLDEGNYLTEEEKQSLIAIMQENITEGNGIVLIASDVGKRSSESDTVRYAKSQYTQYCGFKDGIVFVIDMSTRYIELVTMENYVDRISNYTAANICDGVYQYASKGDYYGCCANAIKMVGAETGATSGREEVAKPEVKVPKTMHIVTNILLALAIALILNFFLLKFLSRTPEADAKALAGAADVNINIEPGNHVKTHSSHVTYELGSLEGIICTRNWFGKLIHLICFVLIVAFRILASGGSSGGGGRSGGSSGGGGRSGGGGHRF